MRLETQKRDSVFETSGNRKPPTTQPPATKTINRP